MVLRVDCVVSEILILDFHFDCVDARTGTNGKFGASHFNFMHFMQRLHGEVIIGGSN